MDLSGNTSPEFLAESNGPSITATASLMIFFCTFFVGLRYYSRYLAGTALNIEDVIIPFAWVAEIGLCVVGIGAQHLYPFLLVFTNTRFSHGRGGRNRPAYGVHPLHRSRQDTRALQRHHDPRGSPSSRRRFPQTHRRPPLSTHLDAQVGAHCRQDTRFPHLRNMDVFLRCGCVSVYAFRLQLGQDDPGWKVLQRSVLCE
jgi:hypothetical protein